MSDQLVAEAAAYTKHNKYNRRTSTSSTGFEPAIPAIKRPHTHALDCTATGIGMDRMRNAICMKHYASASRCVFCWDGHCITAYSTSEQNLQTLLLTEDYSASLYSQAACCLAAVWLVSLPLHSFRTAISPFHHYSISGRSHSKWWPTQNRAASLSSYSETWLP